MNVQFGFFGSDETYRAVVPDHFDPIPEIAGAYTQGPASRSIQFAYAKGSPLNPSDRWGSSIGYLRDDLPRIDAGFDLPTRSGPGAPRGVLAIAGGYLWTQVEAQPQGDEALQDVLSGLAVSEGRGRPRIAIKSPLLPADATAPDEREQVIFYTRDLSATPWSVVFTNTGALGSDATQIGGNIQLATVATDLGVTVTCDGPIGDDAVGSTAAAVATSVTRMRQAAVS